MKKGILLIGLLTLLGAATLDQNIQQQRQLLDRLEREVQQQRAMLQASEQKSQAILQRLDSVKALAAKSRTMLVALESHQAQLQQSASQTEREAQSLQSQIIRQKKAMHMRIRSLYRAKLPGGRPLPNTPKGYHDLVEWKRLISIDKEALQHFAQALRTKDSLTKKLAQSQSEIAQRRQQSLQYAQILHQTEVEQNELLHQTESERDSLRLVLQQRERTQTALSSVINRLESKLRQEMAKASVKSNKPKATTKPSTRTPQVSSTQCAIANGPIAEPYGWIEHPILKTRTQNKGVEIDIMDGAPLRATRPGRVEMIKNIEGLGNTIVLSHAGGYFSLVAPLQAPQFDVGDEVPSCALLGHVAPNAKHHVFFQVFQGKQHIDPASWLKGSP